MATSDGLTVRCRTCGEVAVDAALVELHRDRLRGFTLATYLCCGCGEVGASRCPELLAELQRAQVPELALRCTTRPAIPDPAA